MDVVALAQSGIGNAVATLGTATSALHIQNYFASPTASYLVLTATPLVEKCRVARHDQRPALCDRHTHDSISIPTTRARSRQFRTRIRRGAFQRRSSISDDVVPIFALRSASSGTRSTRRSTRTPIAFSKAIAAIHAAQRLAHTDHSIHRRSTGHSGHDVAEYAEITGQTHAQTRLRKQTQPTALAIDQALRLILRIRLLHSMRSWRFGSSKHSINL